MKPHTPEEAEEARVKGDRRAFLSQIGYATKTLRRAPTLMDIVEYGFPFEWGLNYEGRKEEITIFLRYAIKEKLVAEEKGKYLITKKGRAVSDIGYVPSE